MADCSSLPFFEGPGSPGRSRRLPVLSATPAAWSLFVFANKLTTAANAILLQYTAPIYAAVFGWILLKEKATLLDWATIAVVLGGMVLFFLDRLGAGGMAGNLIAILSGIFFAGSMVALRRQKDGSPLESILLSHLIMFLVSIPFLWGPLPNLRSVAGLACLGVFQIGVPSFLLTYGVKRVTALQSLLTSVLEPIFNPIWVFLVLGETPGAARACRRRHHPGCCHGALRGQPSIGGPAGWCRLTSRTPARMTTPPTICINTIVSPRSATPPSTPTTGMRLT